MKFLFHRRLFIALLLFSLMAPAFANENAPVAPSATETTKTEVVTPEPTAQPTPVGNTTGVALYSPRLGKKEFQLEVWKLEHDEIQQVRANRHNPIERGLWYSTRSREEKDGRYISDAQFPLIASELAYLALAGRDGRAAALNGAQAMLVTGAITMSVKKVFRRRRPYPNDYKFGTFPSGHTSSTFTMAGILGAAQPSLRVPALLGASMVGWSRVKVRAHHWQDVLAGAALGLAVSNQFKPDKKVKGPLANLNFHF